jgi:exo-beta-1,3-glucanase (GH17 family)
MAFALACTKTVKEPGDTITEAQVERRIKILKPYSKWIRSFSCIEGNEHIPRLAHKHGLKTMVGAWLSDDDEKNEEEINASNCFSKRRMCGHCRCWQRSALQKRPFS